MLANVVNNLLGKADLLVREVYKVTLDLRQIYQFSVGEQLRRASLSIVLNIVEGGQEGRKRRSCNFLAFRSDP